MLKGLINLSSAGSPRGTRAPMLDTLARAPIWAAGTDYAHGSGHDVGFFLNVHEGPQSISPSAAADPHTAMEAGMITSIEPGIYGPGNWGVHIENLVLSRSAGSAGFGEYLMFETLSPCPIDTRCLAPALLRPDEFTWLNEYHAEVRTRLTPLFGGAALDWLTRRTAPIGPEDQA